jgi:hypothetical protein
MSRRKLLFKSKMYQAMRHGKNPRDIMTKNMKKRCLWKIVEALEKKP